MSVNAKMKAICDNIRLRTGGTALLNLDEIAEAIMYIGEATDLATLVYRTIGTTFPPIQLPASADYDSYDIDIYNCMADDVHAYIDEVLSGKDTVTKEILGKDGSGQYNIARYIYANREQFAWVKKNYPKMYAWKNGPVIKYTESVSPRIEDKAYDVPYVQTSQTQTVNIPAKAAVIVGKRYSLSGGSFKDNAPTSSIILPLPTEITGDISIKLVNMSKNTTYAAVYGGVVNNKFTETVYTLPSGATTEFTLKNSDYTVENFKAVSNFKFVTFPVNSTGASGQYNNSQILVNGVAVPFEITTDPAIAMQESTTTTTTEGGGTSITAVSAANRTRTIDGLEYVRYENGDVAPTVIYTDKDDERNGNATITKDGTTYYRYPIGDLGANKTKLTPIFIYANVHGVPKSLTDTNVETKMCALVAARFLRDLAIDKQIENPLYKYIRSNCMVIIIPVANPYGFNYNLTADNNGYGGYYTHTHANINRNYDTPGWDALVSSEDLFTRGTYPGSEIETQYIMNTMVESGAVVAMSLHGVDGFEGYCLHQGQNPNPNATSENDKYIDYNQEKLAKIEAFLKANYGYTLRYYDMENGEPVRCKNTPDKTSKDPSFISQCGAYGGIIEFQPDDPNTSGYVHEMKSNVIENAYAQTLNMLAMWLSDYLETN